MERNQEVPSFTNADGSCRFYAIIDPRAERVVATFNWSGEAGWALDKIAKTPDACLELHNLTHPACPAWLKAAIRRDKAYCLSKAAELAKHAATARAKAAKLIEAAEAADRRADEWRASAE